MSFMFRGWKSVSIGICQQVTEEVDCLSIVLKGNPFIVAVKTSYVGRVHECWWKTVDVWTELEVMFRISASNQQRCQHNLFITP